MKARMTYLLLVFLLLLPHSEQVLPQCEPVEEGKSHTFTCRPNVPCPGPLLFKWTAGNQLISHCDQTLDCTGNNQNVTTSVWEQESLPSTYSSNVTISQVYDNGLVWACDYCGGKFVQTCQLQTYVKPVNPQCQVMELMNSGDFGGVALTCTMDRVYPRSQCLFQVIGEDGKRTDIFSQKSRCQTTAVVNELNVGLNRFEARVGSSEDPGFDSIQFIPVSPSVQLRLPKTRIVCPGHELKDGFYKGDSVECYCALSDLGKPRGTPGWYRASTLLTDPETGRNDILVANYQVKTIGPTYTCAGTSRLGQEMPGNSFFPSFAFYRPGGLSIESTYNGSSPVNICCGNPGVLLTCKINDSVVNPAPNFALLVDDVIASGFMTGIEEAGIYAHNFKFLPKVGGIYTIGCRIENSIFPDLTGESINHLNVTIHGPVQFAEASVIKRTFETGIEPDTEVLIKFGINAYPNVISSILYKGDLNQNITVEDFTINYTTTSLSAQTVELIMQVSSASDWDTYTLLMDNGIGDGLAYTFSLEEDTSDDDVPLLPLVLGICAGVLIITVIIVVIVWRRRRRKSSNTGFQQPDGKENKAFDDPENEKEESIYNNPQDEEPVEENEYEEYVDTVDASPTAMAPRPPTTKHPRPSADKAKAPKQTKNITPKPAKPKPPKKPKGGKDANKSAKQELGESSESKVPGYNNMGSDGPVSGKQASDVPPPRPPPRKGQAESLYANVGSVAPGAEYDAADEADEEKEYLEINGDPDSSRADQGAGNESENYYSAINDGEDKPKRVLY